MDNRLIWAWERKESLKTLAYSATALDDTACISWATLTHDICARPIRESSKVAKQNVITAEGSNRALSLSLLDLRDLAWIKANYSFPLYDNTILSSWKEYRTESDRQRNNIQTNQFLSTCGTETSDCHFSSTLGSGSLTCVHATPSHFAHRRLWTIQ